VVTGCAHPGIVEILRQSKNLFDEQVYLVLGGFHLRNKSKHQVSAILNDFRLLEVQHVAPCHCTGDLAIGMFKAEFGDDFIHTGVGKVIRIDLENP
jgi:7,8-dihydropterin-6-yl-methyl-4-(beta-D-ribofuranosyl)aminobenzene 5'-phosphate synthase